MPYGSNQPFQPECIYYRGSKQSPRQRGVRESGRFVQHGFVGLQLHYLRPGVWLVYAVQQPER